MKSIYLGEQGPRITVSDGKYAQIVALIEESSVCETCGTTFTDGNPCVALNRCLDCFVAEHPAKQFRLIGKRQGEEGSATNYQFLDASGFVYFSHPHQEPRKVERSVYHTITHWGFPVPSTYTRDGKQHDLDRSSWRVYGDVRKNSAVLIEYSGVPLVVAFLAYKAGELVEINRRMAAIRGIFRQAVARILSTKDEDGYHIGGGRAKDGYSVADIYDVISDIASETYNDQGERGVIR